MNIREHEFNQWDSTGTVRWCVHCNIPLTWSQEGGHLPQCIERFDLKAFQKWLDYHNYSQIDPNTFIRRYSSDEISRDDIMKMYEKAWTERLETIDI